MKKVHRAASEALDSEDEEFINQIITVISSQKKY
jgi:hypothetical protein